MAHDKQRIAEVREHLEKIKIHNVAPEFQEAMDALVQEVLESITDEDITEKLKENEECQ